MHFFPRSAAVLSLLLLFCSLQGGFTLYNGLFCGKQSCYDVLGVSRNATKQELQASYRRLQRQLHPDKRNIADTSSAEYLAAEKEYHLVRTAYETLKDAESRTNYEYLLDNPDEFYYHWWSHNRSRFKVQVNAWTVILAILIVISIMQYYLANSSHDNKLLQFLEDERLRNKYISKATKDGHGHLFKSKDSGKRLEKYEVKKLLLSLYSAEMEQGAGMTRLTWNDVICMRILRIPIDLPVWIYVRMNRFYRVNICGQEYTSEDKLLLTKSALNWSDTCWARTPEAERAELIGRELWIDYNLAKYKQEIKSEALKKSMTKAQVKKQKRLMKRGEPVFMED